MPSACCVRERLILVKSREQRMALLLPCFSCRFLLKSSLQSVGVKRCVCRQFSGILIPNTGKTSAICYAVIILIFFVVAFEQKPLCLSAIALVGI